MTTSKPSKRTVAAAIAEQTADSFSFDRYRNWKAVAAMLLARGLNEREAEAVLRSKWTRWAADAANKKYGRACAEDLETFMNKMKDCDKQIKSLTLETFGEAA
jgi:hypothetical protein